MAAKLNKPSDFKTYTDVTSANGEPVRLLPPSSFESGVTGTTNPLQQLASATSEILNLKQQNQQLRECKQVSLAAGEEIKARVDVHQTSPQPLLHSTQLDGIINRQATEISRLRERLQTQEGQYQRQVTRLESQVLVKDAENKQQVGTLQQEIQSLQKLHQDQMNRHKEALESSISEQMAKIKVLECELEKNTKCHRQTVAELEQNMQAVRQEYDTYRRQTETQLRDNTSCLSEYKAQLEQHRQYISDTEQATQSTQVWRNQIDTLNNKVQILESEKTKLESTLELINIRLKSQNDIHVIQEQQLAQVKESSNEKKKAVLLTRWREKVFELLVQLESASISQRNTQRNYQFQVQNLENELESRNKAYEVLEHKLTDKQAELDMEKHNVKSLQVELTSAQQMAIQLDDRNREYQVTISGLVDFANGIYEKYCESEKSLTEAQSKLSSYNKRISFASGRIEMLQSQFARREALLKVELEEKYKEKPTKDVLDTDEPTEHSVFDSIVQISEELERVQRERDQLAAQIKQDAGTLEEKINMARQQVADEVQQLRQRNTELHQELEQKNTELESLQASVDQTRSTSEEYQGTIEQLQLEMGRLQVQNQKDIESAHAEGHTQLTEQLAEMEHRLNDARREHTKAMVSLRQIERQSERDRERRTAEMEKMEEYYKQHIVRLEQNIRVLESDRNLLMTTLRQEGLVGKYKAARGSPIPLQETTDTVDELQSQTLDTDIQTGTQDLEGGTGVTVSSDKVVLSGTRDTYFEDTAELAEHTHQEDTTDNVLDELKQLSEEVLQDSDESSD